MREYLPSDLPQLRQIWLDVFGDPPELIDGFFCLLPQMGTCCVEAEDGIILGAAYLMHGFTLHRVPSESVRCGYLYAVAVREDFRHRGIGEAVSRGAAELGRRSGIGFLCTLPAERSLYDWYGRILGLHEQSLRRRFRCAQLPSTVGKLSPSEYGIRRETILAAVPHVALNSAAMEFQSLLCETYGGGLYGNEDMLFCAYRDGREWLIQELIPASDSFSMPSGFQSEDSLYLCSDVSFPEGTVWNLTFD